MRMAMKRTQLPTHSTDEMFENAWASNDAIIRWTFRVRFFSYDIGLMGEIECHAHMAYPTSLTRTGFKPISVAQLRT